jgi:hypothetical protein
MQDELSTILGRRVDLNTPGFLSPYFRDRVLAEAETIHERASRRRSAEAHAGCRGSLKGTTGSAELRRRAP